MAVWHDYRCEKHGEFESTHDICPHMGCDSSKVTMIFKKAPGVMSGKTKAFDKGVRNTAEQYNLDYLRSSKEGDTSYGGHAGGGVLWGDKAAAAFGGLEGMAAAASQGVAESRAFARAHGAKDLSSGMRMTATDLGMTKQVTPPTTVQYSDRGVK